MNIPENVWTNKNGNGFLSLYSAEGKLLGYIDANGVPQGSLATGNGGNTPLTSTITLSNSQLLNLSTTPVVLIPAPGFGSYVMPQFVTFQLNVGTTPFQIANSGSGSTVLYWSLLGEGAESEYGIVVVADSANAGIDYTNSASQLFWTETFLNTQTSGSLPSASLENSPVVIKMDDALSVGNGTMTVVISYTIVPV
jgi:hypothetical protein